MRYVNPPQGTGIYLGPGGRWFAKLVEGQALRLTGAEKNGYVEVQPVDAQGRRSGEAGWVKRSDLTDGGASTFRFGNLTAGPAGRAMLNRECSSDYHRCAASAQEVDPRLPRPIGVAANYITRLPREGWTEVTSGFPRPDDVVVYGPTSSNPAGHMGFIVIQQDGTPMVVSNLNGNIQVHRIDAVRGAVHIFRR